MWIAAGQGGRRRGGRRTRCGANDAAWDGGSNEGRKCTDRLIRSRGAGALRRMIRQRVESERRVWERERERESACERKREEKEGRQRAHAAPLEERASNEPPLPSSHRDLFLSALSALSVNPRLIQAPPPPPPPLASSSFLLNAAGGRHKYPRVGRTDYSYDELNLNRTLDRSKDGPTHLSLSLSPRKGYERERKDGRTLSLLSLLSLYFLFSLCFLFSLSVHSLLSFSLPD